MLRNTVDYVVSANRWVKECTERFDAVYVFEVSPVTVGLPAVSYKKKFGVPMFFNLQDLWPENVEEVLGIRFAPLTWLINRIVDTIYSASDKILCTSGGFVENLRQRGVPQENRSSTMARQQMMSSPTVCRISMALWGIIRSRNSASNCFPKFE